MFGGGDILGGQSIFALMDNISATDDVSGTFEIEAYLTGPLERFFSSQWGEEGNEPDSQTGSPPEGSWFRRLRDEFPHVFQERGVGERGWWPNVRDPECWGHLERRGERPPELDSDHDASVT